MIYRFEDFELNTNRQELRKAGVPQPLQPQVYALLKLLVVNHDRVVTKDEINDEIWHGRAISEAVVNSRIRSVRLAVGDDGKSQRIIKTIHSRGFGFFPTPEMEQNGKSPTQVEREKSEDEQSGGGISNEQLRNLSQHQTKIAITVLPFVSMSKDSEQDYFADGVTEDIVTALTNVTELSVFTHNIAGRAGEETIDIQKIGRRNNAQFMLEGSVRRIGDDFRVSAQLIDVATESHVWAERYDRKLENIFALQDDMTREIISALQVKITDGDIANIWAKGTSDFSAWEAVLKARKYCMKHTKSDVLAGRGFAEQAIAIDNKFSSAWRWLSFSYWAEALGGWSDNPLEALVKAKELAEQSVSLDDDNAGTLGLLAIINVALRQYDIAEQAADRIVKLGSRNDYAMGAAATAKLFCGDVKSAAILIDHAINLAPSPKSEHFAMRAMVLLFLDRLEEAIVAIDECLRGHPKFLFGLSTKAIILVELGKIDEAKSVANQVIDIDPDFVVQTFGLYQPYRDDGMIRRCLDGLRKAGIPES